MSFFLGIDTSNYTTSTALYDSKTGEMVQQKKLLPVKEGQLGLRQSDAVFHHTAQLHTLIEELLKDVDTSKIAAIAASSRPRPVDGSYMPCFTVGENTAKILSSAMKIPLYTFRIRRDTSRRHCSARRGQICLISSLSLSMSAEEQPRQYLPRASAQAFPLNLRHTLLTSMQGRRLTAQDLCSD